MENELTIDYILRKLREHKITEDNFNDYLKERYGKRFIEAKELNSLNYKGSKESETSKKNMYDYIKDNISDPKSYLRLLNQDVFEVANVAYRELTNVSSNYFKNLLDVSKKLSKFDIFLSHAYKDRLLVYGVYLILTEDFKYSVYIDWLHDPYLAKYRDKSARRNIRLLQLRMNQSKSLKVLRTTRYHESKWIAWEIGYFNGSKDKVLMLQVKDIHSDDDKTGNGFVKIYPKEIMVGNKLLYEEDKTWKEFKL